MQAILEKNAEKLRFILIGGINTAIDFGILFSLVAEGVNPLIGNIISTSAAFIFSFVANKNYTFKSRHGNLRRQLLLFTFVTLFGLWVLQNIVISISRPVLQSVLADQSYVLAISKVLAILVSLTWNYIMYSRVVFKTQ